MIKIMDEITNADKTAQIVSDAINSTIKADVFNNISKMIEDLQLVLEKQNKGCFLSKAYYRFLFFRRANKIIAYVDKCIAEMSKMKNYLK